MYKIDKSFAVIMALLLLTAAISWTLYFKEYRQQDTTDIHAFSKQVGEWTSEEITITDREYAILETRNAFSRKYTNKDGDAVILFIVYSQTNRKVVHPPEICYTGGGNTILSNVYHTIAVPEQDLNIKVNNFVVENGPYKQSVCYWFKVGSTFTSNYLKGQALIAVKRLLGRPASGAMIRVAANEDPEHPERTVQLIDQFTREITPLLFQYLP